MISFSPISSGRIFVTFSFFIVQCDDSQMDYEKLCGYGATGCLGNATEPLCQCDAKLQLVPAADGRECVPRKKCFCFEYLHH